MTAQELKNSILQLAIQGKLVKQDPNDEPASVLLEKIKEEREKLIKEKKIKREKYSEIYKDSSDNHYYEKFEDGNINDITEEIPFDIPDSWRWTRLKSILSVKGGKRIPKGKKLLDTPTKHIYIRVTDMKNNTIDSSKIKYISNDVFEQIKNYTISSNDLYLTIAGTIGNVGIVPKEFDNMNLTENAVKLCDLLINKELLLYFIQSQFIQNQFVDKTNKVAQPKLAIIRIESTLIPIPARFEQEKIISKLKLLFQYIKKYSDKHKIIEGLNNSYKEELKKSILQYAIQGKLVKQDPKDESAEVLINKILDEKRKLIKTKQIKKENLSVIYKESTDNQFYEKFDDGTINNITDEIPFEIPNNWSWTRLGNILNKLSDGTHKTPKYTSYGIPFLSVKDMSSGSISFENAKYISKEEHQLLYQRCNPEKGDILISKIGTTGIPVIIDTDKEFSLFVSIALLKFNNIYINREFLRYLLLSPLVQKQCRENTKGVGNKNWVMKDIAHTLITIPPIEMQYKITDKINKLFKII